MSTLERIARYGAIAGFIFVSSGCVIAPGHEHERDQDARDRDHRCDDRDHDRDNHCHDRYR